MYSRLFSEFLVSDNSLQVYEGDNLIFASSKDRLLPLLEYIDRFAAYHQQVVIFDKVIGRAAALLCARASCREVYSPLGSQLAVKALDEYGIKYHLTKVVPYIQQLGRDDMCPMEKLSLDKGPEEFYEAIRSIISEPQTGHSGNN